MENIKFFEDVCKDKNFKNLPAGIRIAANTYFISNALNSPDAILSQLGFSASEDDIRDAAEYMTKHDIRRVIITSDNENPIAAAKALCDRGWKIEGFVADPDESRKAPALSMVCEERCNWVDVRLVRSCPSEGEVGIDAFALVLTDDDFEQLSEDMRGLAGYVGATTETILRERVAKWLSTRSGWDAICEVHGDFNWGDVIDTIPAAEIGVRKNTEFLCPAKACVDIVVNQDERLAPRSVSAELLYRLPDGRYGKDRTVVDFLYGSVEKPYAAFSVLGRIAEAVILANGEKIDCVTDKMGNICLSDSCGL